jgi:hypothetical protein
MINRTSWLAMRTRWKFSARGNLWRGLPSGAGVLTVFKDRSGHGWRYCISLDGEEPIFSPDIYRTRQQAKDACAAEATREWEAA